MTILRMLGALLLACAVSIVATPSDAATPFYYNPKEITCLAENIYHESRGEPTRGQTAVAFVTLNRVRSGRYRHTVCAVVYQRGQFSWVGHFRSRREKIAWVRAKKLANHIYLNYNTIVDPTFGATFFDHGHTNWRGVDKVTKIGHHIFYRHKGDPIFNIMDNRCLDVLCLLHHYSPSFRPHRMP